MKIDFNHLKSVFGTTLPSKEEFLANGENQVTLRHIAIHYGVRKGYGHTVYDQFVEEFAKMWETPTKPKKAPVAKKEAKVNDDKDS